MRTRKVAEHVNIFFSRLKRYYWQWVRFCYGVPSRESDLKENTQTLAEDLWCELQRQECEAEWTCSQGCIACPDRRECPLVDNQEYLDGVQTLHRGIDAMHRRELEKQIWGE